MTRTYGSLFSGVGGFDMGFDQARYECLFQVEWDKHCQSILQKHWPDVPKFGDVQEVKGDQISPVDVLIFGSPCQDLSVAGKRAGIDGGRSSMFFEATRIIKEMRNATGNTHPRVVVWENVPGALSSNKGADFQAVLDEMGNCGSHLTEWAVLDAQHFGVPQRRRRIFLVAVLDPAIARNCPDPLFPVAEGRRGDYAKGIPTGEDIAALTANGVGMCGADANQDQAGHLISLLFQPKSALEENWAGSEIKNALRAGESKVSHAVIQSTAVKAKRAMSNTDFDRWEETDLCPTLNAFDNTGESRATIIAFTAQRVGEPPRIYEDSTPALLSRMGTGGNNTPMVTQPAVRRLTPLECERLMGWPDDHTRWTADGIEQADTHRYKQCGNGVATPVAKWVANQIGATL